VGGGDWAGALRYGYDQRDLLITSTVYVTSTGWTDQVQYVYDGEGNPLAIADLPDSATWISLLLGHTWQLFRLA
jgi:YD repeat-containing protein